MRVTILDYGAGNLHSLTRALACDDTNVVLERDPFRALETDVLVLPGVGGFSPAAAALAPARHTIRAAIARGLPTIGVCLGMQLLFDASDEGPGDGLGLVPGRVTRVEAKRVPHMGWNTLDDASDSLLAVIPLDAAYFANGFACRPNDPSCVTAWSTHERDRFPAMIRATRGGSRVVGFQFHPEKSSRAGARLLRRAVEEVAR
jgi:glutamine amidotransferase